MWHFNEILEITLHYVTLLCTAPFFHFIRAFVILNYCPLIVPYIVKTLQLCV